jgi:hypothetical protein
MEVRSQDSEVRRQRNQNGGDSAVLTESVFLILLAPVFWFPSF